MSHTQQTCCGRRWDGYHYRDCSKPAKVEVEGKHYCGIHNPIAIAEKQAKRDAKWAEERKAEAKARAAKEDAARRAECFPDLLAALKLCAGVVAGETMHKRGLVEALEAARAAIKKAEGL